MLTTLRNSAIALFLAGQLLAAAAFAQAIGRIDYASGVVRVERGTQVIAGVRGTDLLEGDVVVTGPGVQVQLRMVDDAFLALRPNSRLTLDKYRFNRPREADGVVVTLAHGILRAFTGALAERARERFEMKTPLATVGIRGSGNILAHLGDEGTVNHTITGAHSVTALDEVGRVVTVITRPGQTVQVRPGAPPRFIATPSYIFAAASSAPPAQVAAATSGSDRGATGSGSGGGGGGDATTGGSSASTSGGSESGRGDTTSSGTGSTSTTSGGSTSTSGDRSASGSSSTTGGLGGTAGGTSSSPSSNVQTAVAPANVRTGGSVGGSGLSGLFSLGLAASIVNPQGGRAGIFATDPDPGYSPITLDAAGFITGGNLLDYRSVPGAYHPDSDLFDTVMAVRGGTPADYFRNVEQNIVMGRLQNASMDVSGAEGCACAPIITRTDVTAPGGLVFVAYNEAPLGVLYAYTGTTQYRLDGATRPIDSRGNVGTLNTATLSANFTTQTLDFAFSLSVNNLVYTASASGVYMYRSRFETHYDPTNANRLNVTCSGSGCAPAYFGAVNGAFAGTGSTAWLAYHLFPENNSDLVNGAVAFTAITAPVPRYTFPVTGTWNMVMIDNYTNVGAGFPAFSTNATAQINFSTQRAAFSFDLNRILTPADVSAGFQPQSINASASNVPIVGVGFNAQTAGTNRPSNLTVTCTGCGTAPPIGRFEGFLSYVDPSGTGGNLNIYWFLTNATSGTLGYDYAGSTYFGNAPGTLAPASALARGQVRLARMPEAIRGPLRPGR